MSFDLFRHGRVAIDCGASKISSSSRLVVEGVFRKFIVIHSLNMVDQVLFEFGSGTNINPKLK
jgi:hypothetical protein